jgi:type III secretion protein N (ATPase)
VSGRGAGWVLRALDGAAVAVLPRARVGDGVRVHAAHGAVPGQVAAVERGRVALVPFGPLAGVAVGDRVELDPAALRCVLGYGALGRALDATGAPLDSGPPPRGLVRRVTRGVPAPAERQSSFEPLWTSLRVLDALFVLARGARIGIFGPPGTGKSTLLEALARHVRADAVVIGLIGERGREARAWLERVDRRTTLVCATADRSAAERVRAADLAMAQACALRARGLHVVLILDSLARYAAALREQRLALGEPLGRGGFPPGVWAELANFVERGGAATHGSLTLFATVLTDEDEERDPLATAARSLLDGHLVLSAAAARAGRFPAIDVVASLSRTMRDVVDLAHRDDALRVREACALLQTTREVRQAGLADLTEPRLARALDAEPEIEAFLRSEAPAAPERTRVELRALAARVEAR